MRLKKGVGRESGLGRDSLAVKSAIDAATSGDESRAAATPGAAERPLNPAAPCEITYDHPDYIAWCWTHHRFPEVCIRALEAELAEVLVKEAQARFEWGTWEARAEKAEAEQSLCHARELTFKERAEKAETELATTKQCDCSYHNEIHFTARKEAKA